MRQAAVKLIILTMCIVLLVSCQATPDKPVVVQKDMEQMIEKAALFNTETGKPVLSLKERLGIPDKLVFESSEDKLSISVNASVTIPETDKMPIYNVKSAVFSQEMVDKYWDELVGDQQMWEINQQPTKTDIEQMIINQKMFLADTEQEGNNDSIKALNERIVELERLYKNAPETTEVMPAKSQLKEEVNWDPIFGTIDSRYMGTFASSVKSQAEMVNEYCYFSVRNPWTGPQGSIESDIGSAVLRWETSVLSNNYFKTMQFDEDIEFNESVKKYLKLSPNEARKKVEDLLKKTGTPMQIYSIELISDGNEYEGKPAQHYAYRFTCARVVDGLPVASKVTGVDWLLPPDQYIPRPPKLSYSIPWHFESMSLRLDDQGFFEIVWSAPLEILSTEVEDCNLLAFEDIKAVFEKMMYVSYEPNIQDGYTMTCEVCDVRLELMRIRKQDSDKTRPEGLLIPVWNFYGTAYITDGDNPFYNGFKVCLLNINAIDGSVIDVVSGY